MNNCEEKKIVKRTQGQLQNQQNFVLANAVLHPFRPVLSKYYVVDKKRNDSGPSSWNLAIGAVMRYGICEDEHTISICLGIVKLAKGVLPIMKNPKVKVAKGGLMKFLWNNEAIKKELGREIMLTVFVYNAAMRTVKTYDQIGYIEDGKAIIKLGCDEKFQSLLVWCVWEKIQKKPKDGLIHSDSVFLGKYSFE